MELLSRTDQPRLSLAHRSVGPVDNRLREATVRPPRIVLYSHDTLGFGHLRRNLLLANALKQCAGNPEILMIAGMREAGAFEVPAGVDCLTLPAYSKGSDGTYQPRDLGEDLGKLKSLRAETIRAALKAFDPQLMVVDNVPRGAQAELDSSLRAMRKQGRTRLVLGLRDVIDTPATVRKQWLRQRNFEAIRDFYDDVWIYGDPALYDVIADCGLGEDFRRKSVFTGYLDQSARLLNRASLPCRDAILGDDPRPYVLCAVGGGKDGGELCEAFTEAVMPTGHRGILVTGSQMGAEQRRRIQQRADANADITVVEFIKEPMALMEGAAGIVSMGGYNTVCEVLSLGRPALIVPRVVPRLEQWLRAERLAALGLVDMVHPDQLDADCLSLWMNSLHDRPDTSAATAPSLDMAGLDRVTALANWILNESVAPLRVAS